VSRHDRGFSLLEIAATVAIIGLLLLITVPAFATYRRHAAVTEAASEFRAIFRLVRSRAIARHNASAVKFAQVGRDWTYALHDDGDGDGVRNDDIAAGIDKHYAPPRLLLQESKLAAIQLPPNLSIKDPDGDPLTSNSAAVQFGRSTLCSFSPTGESSSGTIYLTDKFTELWCVRVYGATGKVRLLRYNRGAKTWERR